MRRATLNRFAELDRKEFPMHEFMYGNKDYLKVLHRLPAVDRFVFDLLEANQLQDRIPTDKWN